MWEFFGASKFVTRQVRAGNMMRLVQADYSRCCSNSHLHRADWQDLTCGHVVSYVNAATISYHDNAASIAVQRAGARVQVRVCRSYSEMSACRGIE